VRRKPACNLGRARRHADRFKAHYYAEEFLS
jgi:hypothetical protein